MKNRTTALLSLLLAALFALAVFSACIERPTNDATPAPSEAVGSPSGEDVTPAADVTNSPSGEDRTGSPSGEDRTGSPSGEDGTGSPSGEDPSEAESIDEAWSVLNRVGEVHDITLDRKTAEIRDYGSTYEVSIYDAERKEGFGISVHIVEGKPQISRSSIVYWPPDSEGRITMPPAWSPEHLMPIIYVTDEEIIAEGCTVTEGMEYYNTIARLYAEKVAELYRNEKEDSPFYSKEVRISQSVCVDEENKTYRIILAMRGANLPLRMEYSDYTLGFDDGSSDSELLGWVNFGGEIRIWERTDDAWLSRPVFRNNSAA